MFACGRTRQEAGAAVRAGERGVAYAGAQIGVIVQVEHIAVKASSLADCRRREHERPAANASVGGARHGRAQRIGVRRRQVRRLGCVQQAAAAAGDGHGAAAEGRHARSAVRHQRRVALALAGDQVETLRGRQVTACGMRGNSSVQAQEKPGRGELGAGDAHQFRAPCRSLRRNISLGLTDPVPPRKQKLTCHLAAGYRSDD